MFREIPSRLAVVPSVLLLASALAIGAGVPPVRVPEVGTSDMARERLTPDQGPLALDQLPIAASRATVFVFFSAECPLAQKYSRVVESLHQSFCGRDVRFYGVFAGGLADDPGANGFPRDYGLSFAFLEDRGMQLTTALGARITPEVVVVDGDGRIAYQGQIDNWYYGLGKRRRQATRHYLHDALEALLAGRRPEVARTEPIGCLIHALPR